MKRLSLVRNKAVVPPPTGVQQPVPLSPPGKSIRLGHDFESNDPRHSVTEGYLPRTYDTKWTIPEAFKFRYSDFCVMTPQWAKLDYDLFSYFAPKRFLTDPPQKLGEDWLIGFSPKNRMDEWFLHLHTHDRFINNHRGWNADGYYDPNTGFGNGTKPYEQEGIATGGNYMWSAGTDGNYERVWCLDYYATPPSVGTLVKYGSFFLFGIATQVTPNQVDPTPRPEIDCPNGTFEVRRFPQGEGNLVPYLCLSREKTMPTMVWNGISLRQNMMELVRVKSNPTPPQIPYPYVPQRDLMVSS